MLQRQIHGGGFVAYLGTSDALEVERQAMAGEQYPKLIYDAMCYQIAKKIGETSHIFRGDVDAIIFTGSLARSDYILDYVRPMVSFIAPIEVVPGEMEGLAPGALRVLRGEEDAKFYDLLPASFSSKEEFYEKFSPEIYKEAV